MRRGTHSKRQSGSALLVTSLLLLLIGLFGFAALSTVTKDQQVAGFSKRRRIAFYAAEAGVAKALETLTTTLQPQVPDTSLGDASLFPHGRPSFRLDPTATDPLESLGAGAFPGMSLNIGQGGAPAYQINYWRIRVQGRAPGGAAARIETVSGALVAN
jgi:hypothetical protein